MAGDPRWDLLSTIEGWVVGFFMAVSGCVAWASKKFGKVHERINDSNKKLESLQSESAMHRANLMVQQAHHEANQQRLASIEEECTKQTAMLTDLYRTRFHQPPPGGNV